MKIVRTTHFQQAADDITEPEIALVWMRQEVAQAVPAGEPVDEHCSAMLGVREAAELIGKDRSWIIRQLNSGALRGRRVGSEWWIARDWAIQYRDRSGAVPAQART